jgi:L-iditol 2-dehydrogenase
VTATMLAAIVEAPGRLVVRDLPVPVPGPYDVLTRQLFGSICAATDRHLIAGKLPVPGIAYPLILGHESIGRVIEAGSKVRNLRAGDLVTRTGAPALEGCHPFWGGFVEYGIARDVAAMQADGVPEAEWAPHAVNRRLPPGIDPASATMMITWRETHSYLSRIGVPPGGHVLVLGSGGNGFSFAVLARLLGAGRVSMVGNPHWAPHAAAVGVETFIDYRTSPPLSDPTGDVDVIIDAVGHTGGIEAVLPRLRTGGAIGIYGIEDLGERMAFLGTLAARGFRTHGPGDYSEAEAHDAVVGLLEAGKLDARRWFDPAAAVPLTDIAAAIAAIERRDSLKAVVRLHR